MARNMDGKGWAGLGKARNTAGHGMARPGEEQGAV